MKPLYYLLSLMFLIGIILLSSCAVPSNFIELNHNIPLNDIRGIYNPISEKTFCLRDDGSIYGLKYGYLFICPFLPDCEAGDIFVHTHPVYCEDRANFIDFLAFEDYYKDHGVTQFGVFWYDNLKLYEIRRE